MGGWDCGLEVADVATLLPGGPALTTSSFTDSAISRTCDSAASSTSPSRCRLSSSRWIALQCSEEIWIPGRFAILGNFTATEGGVLWLDGNETRLGDRSGVVTGMKNALKFKGSVAFIMVDTEARSDSPVTNIGLFYTDTVTLYTDKIHIIPRKVNICFDRLTGKDNYIVRLFCCSRFCYFYIVTLNSVLC